MPDRTGTTRRIRPDGAAEPRPIPDQWDRRWAGSGALFRGTLTVVISSSDADDRAGVLATFFIAAYAGLSIPVLGLGIALQRVSPRAALLVFGLIVGLGLVAAAPVVVRPPDADTQPESLP